jgi:calcineurin-like phosphoesterase family protein
MKHATRILFIPDVQSKEGVRTDHLTWIGRYAAEKQPGIIVCAGDFADMPSLSDYDKGKKCYEGRRYSKDVAAARKAMELLVNPIKQARRYKPRLILTLGNHEQRISRACEFDAKLEGTIGVKDLCYEEAGWEVHPFLEVVKVKGVHFSHYFTSGVMGKPCTTPNKIINTYHVSAIAGHQQGRAVAYAKRGDGKSLTAIIAGSCYQHDEAYLSPMANKCWRGVVMLNEVRDGQFDEMFVSLAYLKRKFG